MNLSRKEFLNKTVAATAALAFAPLFAMGKQYYPQKKIKIGVIGCGSAANMYLPHLTASPYVALISLCDIRFERAQLQAKKYRVEHCYANFDQMLEGPPFDLLVNLTDIQEHGRLNAQALKAGKHIWSEKPLATTYREGQELLALARENELRIWGAPSVVNSPQFAIMSKTIQEGKLGKISAAHGHYGSLGPDWATFFYEKGGGSLPDLGVYNLTTLTGLLGPAKSVMAMTSIVTSTRKISSKDVIEVQAEDNAMVIMEHENGILSHIQCGYNYFEPHAQDGKGLQRPSITIWGTKGNMNLMGYDWAPGGVDIVTIDNPRPRRLISDPGNYVWQQGATAIAEAMVTGKEPYTNAEHALHILEILEAARESSGIGKKFNLRSTFKWPLI